MYNFSIYAMDARRQDDDGSLMLTGLLSDSPDEIVPGLYLGGAVCAQKKDELLKLGITHILIAADGIEELFPEVLASPPLFLFVITPASCEIFAGLHIHEAVSTRHG